MPYDPTKPVNGTLVDADFLRDQFHGMKDLIDAVPGITAVQVDAVNTLPAGQPASVTASIVSGVLHLAFDIPSGNDGSQGQPGNNGNDGQMGPPGQQGEVTNAALATAIAATSANSNAVATLDTPFINDPPTLADMETMRAKINELLLAMRR